MAESPAQSYYAGLKIYKTAMDLAVDMDTSVRQFARYHKYGIGGELRDLSRQAVVLVAAANQRDNRIAGLNQLCAVAEKLKILVDLAKEIQAFPGFTVYAKLATQVVDLVRQAEAWRRHSSVSKEGPDRQAALHRRPA